MATCPNGHESPEGQPFCGECGAPLTVGEPSPPSEPAPPPAEGPPAQKALAEKITRERSTPGAAGPSSQPTATPRGPKRKQLTRAQTIWGIIGLLIIVGLILRAAGVTSSNSTSSSGTGGGSSSGSGSVSVTYEITGTTNKADLTYTKPGGDIGQQSGTSVPTLNNSGQPGITFSFTSGESVSISAQNANEAGSVTCTIREGSTIVDTNTSTGAFVIAECRGTA